MTPMAGLPSIRVLSRTAGEALYLAPEAAELLGVSVFTLQNWRRPGNASAPPDLLWSYVKEGVCYRESVIRAYLERVTARAPHSPGGEKKAATPRRSSTSHGQAAA